jgi:hypothetical protein
MPAAKTAKKKVSAKNKKTAHPEFAPVFSALRQILEPFSDRLAVQTDKPGNYHLENPSILHRGKPLYFAGVRNNKNYVSFYLMSMYYNPAAVKGLSPALRKRMQGKACFNFASVDQECFAELGRLAEAGIKRFSTPEFRQMIQRMQ